MGETQIGSQNFESWNPLTTEKARLDAILGHVEGTIVFSNTVANGNESYAHNFKVIEGFGIDAVNTYQSEIEKSASKYGVNPDLMKTIVFLENSHGYYDVIKPYIGMGQPTSILPGNVNVETFSKLLSLDPFWTTNDAGLNIELTAKVLAEIQSRLQNPTPEAIATLYNGLMKDQISGYGLTVAEYMKEKAWESRCFPAHTLIQTPRTTSTAISTLRVGDIVLAYDASAGKGRGALVPRRVTRLYRNTTTEWIRLRWQEEGVEQELVTTPGHHFLNEFGHFPRIDEMVEAGRTTVVLASGALTEVTAERILYSAETAHMFERATSVGMIAGNAALQPVEIDAWQTYNIEGATSAEQGFAGAGLIGRNWMAERVLQASSFRLPSVSTSGEMRVC